MNVEKILVPVDGSESAGRAAEFAAYLAQKTGAEAMLIYVMDITGLTPFGLTALSEDEIRGTKERLSERAFEVPLQAFEEKKIEVAKKVLLGDPAEGILTTAREEKVDMIVMGSRGLSNLSGLILGSVSDKVVHHAKCKVTIVK